MQSIGNRPALSVSTAVNAKTPRNMIQMMLGGISWHQAERVNYMPAFEGSLTETQMADIVAYVRATYSKKPAWAQPEKMVSDISKENAQR
jgi:mono/diheme cytochrome c family protein